MFFPHRLKLYLPNPVDAAGTQDAVTGVWTPATPDTSVVFYDGEADVQESTRRDPRGQDGEPRQSADATAYLATTDVFDISHVFVVAVTNLRLKSRVLATITWEDGATEPAEVSGIRRLDGVVLLRRVG